MCADRLSYLECSRILYESNIFTFGPRFPRHMRMGTAAPTFVAFCRTILPERVSMIRHVRLWNIHFHWRHAGLPQGFVLSGSQGRYWSDVCDLLRQMSALSTLHIGIGGSRWSVGCTPDGYRQEVKGQCPEHRLLMQLQGVRASKTFIVEAPWPDEIVGDLSNTTFEFKRIAIDPHIRYFS